MTRDSAASISPIPQFLSQVFCKLWLFNLNEAVARSFLILKDGLEHRLSLLRDRPGTAKLHNFHVPFTFFAHLAFHFSEVLFSLYQAQVNNVANSDQTRRLALGKLVLV